MKTKVTNLNFKGVNVYIGIDSHLKSWKVTIMVDDTFHKTFCQEPDAGVLLKYLKRHFPEANYYSAYESSFCGFSIHRALVNLGIRNIVVNPADIPTTNKERVQKEDKRDSNKIARMLQSNNLEGIYVPSLEVEELRDLVRYRKTLVKEISRNKNRVKSFLYKHGILIPPTINTGSGYWSNKYTQWLSTVETSTSYGQIQLGDIVETTTYLRKKLLKITRKLREVSRADTYKIRCNLLCGIPGVSLITSMTILSEIDDINRFSSLDKLCSYIGLVPSTNSSGESERVGNISKRANGILRSAIIESAWIASATDPALILAFTELKKRMKANRAIIRIAKKLVNRIRYVLKNEAEYVYAVL